VRSRAGIIVQARVASTRLPGKALEQIAGRTILEHCLRRLAASGVAQLVLATTRLAEDDALVGIARSLGVLVYRGATDDVLDRFSRAALAYDLDPIIRATADNPAVDVHGPARLLAALAETDADYVREEGLPCGAAVEAVTAEALHHAATHARSAEDREHVTTFIRRRTDLYRVRTQPAPAPLTSPALRLTVDTPEDLQWVRELYSRVGSESPSLPDLISAAGGAAQQAFA
jgi:spore coat polysaccharide biosynthesis protein SpsF (cytidylyltransferase family)